MKILVVSDTHRQHENLEKVIDRERPERIYHLGDGEGCEDYVEAYADCPLEIVRGNCDFASSLPGEVVMRVGAHVIMLTHGHYYHVANDTKRLLEVAKEKGADVVLYGHTHVPQLFKEQGITVMNPGSISHPRQGDKRPSYGVIAVDDEGEFSYKICYL